MNPQFGLILLEILAMVVVGASLFSLERHVQFKAMGQIDLTAEKRSKRTGKSEYRIDFRITKEKR
jgi:hypothetical protein